LLSRGAQVVVIRPSTLNISDSDIAMREGIKSSRRGPIDGGQHRPAGADAQGFQPIRTAAGSDASPFRRCHFLSGEALKPAPRPRGIVRQLDLATRLPWWGALLSALAAYTLLHAVAVLQTPAAVGTVDLVTNALALLFITLAQIAQYLLPLAFLSAAAISGFDRFKRGRLRRFIADDTTASLRRRPPRADLDLLAGDAEAIAARELTALIRAEDRLDANAGIAAPPVRRPRQDQRRRRSWRPRVRLRKIADGIGILATIGISWGSYQWFLQLPEEPAETPWSLLGTSYSPEGLERRLRGPGRTRYETARILRQERPVGQFRFGPPPGYLTVAELDVPAPEQPPVEVYHSIRELEQAFEAKYVPPPECYAYESNQVLVKCGNHRIRARRTFIESGGKVTPALLGSWEEPRPVVMALRPLDWRRYEQDGARRQNTEWQQDGQPDLAEEWEQQPASTPDRDPDVQELLDLKPPRPRDEVAPGTERDWHEGDGQATDPYREQRETVAQPATEPRADWQQEDVEAPGSDPGQGWRRGWSRQPTPDPEQDWRGEWPRDAGQSQHPDFVEGQSIGTSTAR
jgi:hypothetical protein